MTGQPKRHRFRFSLRTLFVVMTIVALAASTLPTLLEKYRKWEEDRFVRELSKEVSDNVGFNETAPYISPLKSGLDRRHGTSLSK